MAVKGKANNAHPGVAEAEQEARLIQRIALFAFLINLGLAVSSGAIDSATDSIASLVLYAGVKLSSKKSPHFP